MGVHLKTAASSAMILFCAGLAAAAEKDESREAMRDVRFCQGLNDRGLSDYANTFLKRRTQENPGGKILYSTLAVDIFLRQGKFDEAQKLINAIPKDSPAHMQCQISLGYYYFGKKDYKKAKEILEPIYKTCQKEREEAEKAGKPFDLDQYSRAIAILLNAYNQLGMDQEVSRLMSWYQGDKDPRSQTYIDAFLKLSNAETLRKRAAQHAADVEGKIARMLKGSQAAELKKILKTCQDLDKRYAAMHKQSGKVDDRLRKEREDAYRKLGDFINIKSDLYFKNITWELEAPRRIEAFSKRAEIRDVNKQRELARGDKNDWRTGAMESCVEFENLAWEGQDITTAQASVQAVRALYLLGLYEQALEESEKYPELMEVCDQTYVSEGKAEASPAAALKYWTGLTALECARDLEKDLDKKAPKKKKDDCVRMYRLAFVNLGRLVKNYPKYTDVINAYNQFNAACDKLVELDPKRKNAYRKERSKLKKPEGMIADASAGAVPAAAQEHFNAKQYEMVIEELFPLFQEKRASGASMAPILNKLILSYVYNGGDLNMLKAQALARYAASVYPTDEQVKNAVRDAGTLAWREATETAKKNKEAGAALKNDAIYFYNISLAIDKIHPSASVIALQLARSDYNEANAVGERLNKSTNAKERAELKTQWETAQEKTIDAYRLIIDNFSNKDDYVNEAYDKVCSALVSLKRFDDAAKAYEQFANATHDPALKAYAKENVAEMICQIARGLESKAQNLREKISEIVIPEDVAPAPAPAPAVADASAPADGKTVPDAPAPAPAPADGKEAPVADAPAPAADDAKTVPDAADQAKAQEIAKLKAEKAQMEKEADALEKQMRELYAKASSHIVEFRKMLAALAPQSDSQKKEIAATVQRADSLLPWLYDGAGMKKEAVQEFAAYIKKYPDDKAMLPSYMMRLGVLYTEMNMEAESQKALTELRERFPDSPEGKNASFYLARSLYQNGNYSRALSVFQDIFSSDLCKDLSIGNLRWIASNLVSCTSQADAKRAAEFALKASEQLLALCQEPAYLKLGFACDKPENLLALVGTPSNEALKDWVGAARATELLNDPEAMKKYLSLTKQKLLFDAGVAAWKIGDGKLADRYLTDLEEADDNSPYANDLYFLRAEIRIALKRFEDARRDLARIATRGMQFKRLGFWNKAQVLTGETYLTEKDYNKAYASFSFVADALLTKTLDQIDAHSASPEFAPYLEQALYRAAFCASLLGMNQEPDRIVDQYVKKYAELYPNGKYASEIRSLPKPITQK